jgi:hypothetical protein
MFQIESAENGSNQRSRQGTDGANSVEDASIIIQIFAAREQA